MLKLRNIKKTETTIEADYFPENDANDFGHISVNIETKETTISKKAEADARVGFYYPMARMALKRILGSNEPIPKERTIMWY